MQEIITKAKSNYEEKKPFVLFANPNHSILQAYFQKDTVLHAFEIQEGFVFSAFNSKDSFIIPYEKSEAYTCEIQPLFLDTKSAEMESFPISENSYFERLVEQAVQSINHNEFSKVVLSRKVSYEADVDFISSYLHLVSSYVSAFRYLFYHPKIGMWMGASPEQLVQINGNELQTVALAGTQLYQEKLIWEEKEKQEQQFVTDYIIGKLNPLVEKINVSLPFTVQAGRLAHIKTIIDAQLKNSQKAIEAVKVLHPTPAVCGLPKEPALAFILANENYDRKFYSGFLGEWNREKSNLFVNLRCAEIEENTIHFYVGCGITKDSIPEKEFVETENKLGTIQRIIKLKVKS